jgi:hypothetical protein
MLKKITTREARITTCTVAVKTLTVNDRKVTLALFRQLPEEPVIDFDTGQLRGTPWGKVNYFWGDCHPNHLHVVWQKADELRRACVRDYRVRDSNHISCYGEDDLWVWPNYREWHAAEDLKQRAGRLARAVAYRRLLDGAPACSFGRVANEDAPKKYTVRVTVGGRAWEVWSLASNKRPEGRLCYYSDPLFDYIEAAVPRAHESPEDARARFEAARPRHQKALQEDLAAWCKHLEVDEDATAAALEEATLAADAEAKRAKQAVLDRRAEYTRRYEELDALPQLFIAG